MEANSFRVGGLSSRPDVPKMDTSGLGFPKEFMFSTFLESVEKNTVTICDDHMQRESDPY
jgi:hypothetical protein